MDNGTLNENFNALAVARSQTRTAMARWGLLVCFLLSAGLLQAQDTLRLSFNEALQKGLANSKTLKVKQAGVSRMSARSALARQSRVPGLAISGQALLLNSPNVTLEHAENASDSPDGGFRLPGANSALVGQANISEPVFTGFKIKNSIASAEYMTEAARYQAAATESEVALKIIKSLYHYYQLGQSRDLLEHNKAQDHKRVADLEHKHENGIVSKNDLLRARLRESQTALNLSRLNKDIRVANYNLSLLLGLPQGNPIAVNMEGRLRPKPLGVNTLPELVAQGLQNRDDFKAASMSKKAAAASVKVAHSDYYPSLALTGSYISAYAPDAFTATNIINGGIGIQYSISGAIKAKQKVREAKAKNLQASLKKEMKSDQLKRQVNRSYQNYLQALEKIDISQDAIAQAKENKRINKEKYNNQLILLSEYLDADVTLLRSKLNYTNARAQAMIAYYQLKQRTGTLHY